MFGEIMKIVAQKIAVLCTLALLSSFSFANEDPILGKWKTVDDRTGYSRADVLVKKNSDGTYTGTIVETRAVPGRPKMEICDHCPGELKGKPYLGLPFIFGFKQDPKNPNEYIDGKVLDPIGGKIYKSKAKILNNGRRMTIRGYVGISMIGRSVTWIKY